LDINLDGESGIDVRRKLTATWPSIPVIFITGNDNDGARSAAMEAGCIAYLTKPFSANSLLDAIEKASARPPLPLQH
jgi:FixJ family two-component response regulator